MADTTLNTPGQTTSGVTTGQAEAEAAGIRASDSLKAGGEKALQEAKTKMREAAESQRRRAVDAVGGMAGALHRAAHDLNAENETMGRYTDMAAERLDDVASYLRDTDWKQVVEGAEDFARRQPYLFVGGAMLAGFVLARFVKNSGEASQAQSGSLLGQRLAASGAVGYGGGTQAGIHPAPPAATPPISSAGHSVAGGEGV